MEQRVSVLPPRDHDEVRYFFVHHLAKDIDPRTLATTTFGALQRRRRLPAGAAGTAKAGHVFMPAQIVLLPPVMRVGGRRSMNVVARYVDNVDINVWEYDSSPPLT